MSLFPQCSYLSAVWKYNAQLVGKLTPAELDTTLYIEFGISAAGSIYGQAVRCTKTAELW